MDVSSEEIIADRLGVQRLVKHGSPTPFDLHQALYTGLPRRALLNAMPEGIPLAELLPVFGISLRTFMRLKSHPNRLLDTELSDRVWQFTEILATAEDVFGSRARAIEWLLTPAMALEHRRPIDLLTTRVGSGLVADVLTRLRYGVYQ